VEHDYLAASGLARKACIAGRATGLPHFVTISKGPASDAQEKEARRWAHSTGHVGGRYVARIFMTPRRRANLHDRQLSCRLLTSSSMAETGHTRVIRCQSDAAALP